MSDREGAGGREGLAPCPSRPNCVSSEATDRRHRVEPLAFTGPPERARERLLAVLAAEPCARVVGDDGRLLRVEFRTRFFRFVDDVDLRIGDGVIDVRSASRVGWWDLGVNRRRVERLRTAFARTGDSRSRPK